MEVLSISVQNPWIWQKRHQHNHYNQAKGVSFVSQQRKSNFSAELAIFNLINKNLSFRGN